jgi:mono/diheme cytochrome c family protein
MKRFNLFSAVAVFTLAVAVTGCSNDKTQPGKVYIPDMSYSRAVETYALLDSTKFTSNPANRGREIFYNAIPVEGTMREGDLAPYTLQNDSMGYVLSAQVKNPLTPLSGKDSAESARLYNINCAICHGEDGKANGPLSTKVGGVVNLTMDQFVKMTDGTMYHSIHYGKNNMGSYASQLSPRQRWQIIQYVRTLQPKAEGAGAAPAVADSSAVAKK